MYAARLLRIAAKGLIGALIRLLGSSEVSGPCRLLNPFVSPLGQVESSIAAAVAKTRQGALRLQRLLISTKRIPSQIAEFMARP
jgi:hypothetical protein